MDKSYVRKWVEKRNSELCCSNEFSLEMLFAGAMLGLSNFGKSHPKSNIASKSKRLGLDMSEHFFGDGVLFELGCYTCFRIDIWLFTNEANRRESILVPFNQKFTDLFSEALGIKEISKLFDQRLSGYGQLVRTGVDTEDYHYHLSQLILRTKDNELPKTYDFDNSPLVLTGATEDFMIKTRTANWEIAMLPTIIDILKNYCDLAQ